MRRSSGGTREGKLHSFGAYLHRMVVTLPYGVTSPTATSGCSKVSNDAALYIRLLLAGYGSSRLAPRWRADPNGWQDIRYVGRAGSEPWTAGGQRGAAIPSLARNGRRRGQSKPSDLHGPQDSWRQPERSALHRHYHGPWISVRGAGDGAYRRNAADDRNGTRSAHKGVQESCHRGFRRGGRAGCSDVA